MWGEEEEMEGEGDEKEDKGWKRNKGGTGVEVEDKGISGG